MALLVHCRACMVGSADNVVRHDNGGVEVTTLDWFVFVSVLVGIVWYGIAKGRNAKTASAYLRSGQDLPWPVVLMGIMATQASAITFLSAPGQAYVDGMRFVQYYFGLPLAMIVISIVFVPLFRSFNVYTAYEFLEQRFDRRARVLTSVLFLVSRGLSTGISIYAPSIIISSILGWNIYATNVVVGGALILYTWRGGSDSVAHTQKVMFGIILASMAVAGVLVVTSMPSGIGFQQAMTLAGKAGALNIITTDFNLSDKYNLVSGLVGGFFLALAYFGTDQSQVGRFIGGKDVSASRKGLLLNGIVKIPMQAAILFIGAMLVALYAVMPAPIFFNPGVVEQVQQTLPNESRQIQATWQQVQDSLHVVSRQLTSGAAQQPAVEAQYRALRKRSAQVRADYVELATAANVAERSDANYVFLHFVRTMVPSGIVGLIFAVVIMASWGSISAALHSLATASVVDIQHTMGKHKGSSAATVSVRSARWHTLVWGLFCIAIAMAATRMGSLIEAVNVLGSLFYGAMLGIFLVAFFVKRAGGKAVVIAAMVAEALVVSMWWWDVVSFLWLNVVGALAVVVVAWVLSFLPLGEQERGKDA